MVKQIINPVKVEFVADDLEELKSFIDEHRSEYALVLDPVKRGYEADIIEGSGQILYVPGKSKPIYVADAWKIAEVSEIQ